MEGGEAMICVEVRGGDLSRALRVFRNKTAGIVSEVRSREYHLTKAERRRLKDHRARQRAFRKSDKSDRDG